MPSKISRITTAFVRHFIYFPGLFIDMRMSGFLGCRGRFSFGDEVPDQTDDEAAEGK